MSKGSFVDTTVVIGIADEGQKNAAHVGHLRTNPPAEVPYYALRELLAGHLQILATAYTFLKSANGSLGEAFLAISKIPPMAGRKQSQVVAAIAGAFPAHNPAATVGQLSNEMMANLALRVATLWRDARTAGDYALVNPLACFSDGSVDFVDGELRTPNGTFNCNKKARCAAAAHLASRPGELDKMIEALKPENLPDRLLGKREISSRRAALKEVKKSGVTFDKRRCRALGDAYFAAMCPANSAVVTTNGMDFEPLCTALNRSLVVL